VESVSIRAWDGSAYGYRLGRPMRRALLSFQGLPAVSVWARGQVNGGYQREVSGDHTPPYAGYDYSFETNVWRHLVNGERVRVYSDREAVTTYITAAVGAQDTTIAVATGTGIDDEDVIWLDGEEMQVLGGGGSGTLEVLRKPENAVAHSAYAPVSKAHVATYVLDNDGGDTSMRDLAAQSRAYNQTRWDLDIPLLRTSF
jgi:hypothetical protein